MNESGWLLDGGDANQIKPQLKPSLLDQARDLLNRQNLQLISPSTKLWLLTRKSATLQTSEGKVHLRWKDLRLGLPFFSQVNSPQGSSQQNFLPLAKGIGFAGRGSIVQVDGEQ